MKEESKARRELFFNDSETNIIKKFETYEKSLLWKKSENYQKNLLCIQDIADRLLGYMKGHQASFGPEITDENGKFSQEKLSGFVEELLSRWAAKQREGTFRRKHSGTLYPGAAGTVRQLSLCGHAVLPVQGGLCPCDRQRNGGEDGFRFPSGTGEAALEKLVRHGKTG